jgi:hypothetical protein
MKSVLIVLCITLLVVQTVFAATFTVNTENGAVNISVTSTTKISTVISRAISTAKLPRAPRGYVYRLYVGERCIPGNYPVQGLRGATSAEVLLVSSYTPCAA